MLQMATLDIIIPNANTELLQTVTGAPRRDYVAELRAQFLGDALRDRAGGDAPGLGVADLAGDAPAELEADLGQLGGLPGAGLAGHDLMATPASADSRDAARCFALAEGSLT